MVFQPRSRTCQGYAQIQGHPVSTSKEGHLILTNIHSIYKKEENHMGTVSAFTTGNYYCTIRPTGKLTLHDQGLPQAFPV